ncbi:MAG: transposase [Candidatus Omnitrophica bacterium]|nr:transposase [Candidatus Omnitrophota bacterium]
MPRSSRITAAEEYYHVISRGNNSQTLFHRDEDFSVFLELVVGYLKRYEVSLIHYCFMPNHIHFLVRQDCQNKGLAKFMHAIKMCYAAHFHHKYGGTGAVWEGRFKSFHVHSSSYLLECGRYIERNPVKAGMAKEPSAYRYSSYAHYACDRPINFITDNPEYLALSNSAQGRQFFYQKYVQEDRNWNPGVVKSIEKIYA